MSKSYDLANIFNLLSDLSGPPSSPPFDSGSMMLCDLNCLIEHSFNFDIFSKELANYYFFLSTLLFAQ